MHFQTGSDQETKQVAYDLAQKLLAQNSSQPIILSLTGPLGAGKTTFTQGFADGLGIKDKIISPTFILMRQHPVPNTSKVLYHLDLYRLNTEQSLHELGLTDLINDPDSIVVIEWSEKIADKLPEQTIKINFQGDGNNRSIEITEPGQEMSSER